MIKYYICFYCFVFSFFHSFAQRPVQGPMSDSVFTPLDSGYTLVWEDEFLGNELDQTKWRVRGIGKRALGYVSAEAVKVEEGVLKLFALR